MDRCGHALTSKQHIADMALARSLRQTREQRLTLLDGLTTSKQTPSANALEVVARGLALTGQAAQGLGRGLGHERHQQVSGNPDGLEQVLDHKYQLVGLSLVLGKRPGLGVLDVVVSSMDEFHDLILGSTVIEHVHLGHVALDQAVGDLC